MERPATYNKTRCPRCGEKQLRPGLKRCPVCHCFLLTPLDTFEPPGEEWFVWLRNAWVHMTALGRKMVLNRDISQPWQPAGLDEDIVDASKL